MNATMRRGPSGGAVISAANDARNGTQTATSSVAVQSRNRPGAPSGSRHASETSTVAAKATYRASVPPAYADTTMAAPPASSGTSAGLARVRDRARQSSQVPIAAAAVTTT